MFRGSRKHVLDWTDRPEFPSELVALLPAVPIQLSESQWLPRGFREPDEARLERFGPVWQPSNPAWRKLADWWLAHKQGANTPNWDIALGCTIENRPGLVLVEAKANWPELKSEGKIRRKGASQNSLENHQHIGRAIDEACSGWQRIAPGMEFSRDSHYQLANRLAFAWKLATLGFPVVLLYLGFTGDTGIEDVGPAFNNDADWNRAFAEYTNGIVPLDLLGRRLDVDGTPVWLISASRPVLSPSP